MLVSGFTSLTMGWCTAEARRCSGGGPFALAAAMVLVTAALAGTWVVLEVADGKDGCMTW